MKRSSILIVTVVILGVVQIAFGHANYTGYSGAPGSNGSCASSCHGNPGGTIEISGFPEYYVPGQEYEITISHAGGNVIRQFNGSCRIGSGTENAGVISSGTNTATYNNVHETNGIHLSSAGRDNGTFNWTAPSSGTGEVTLYVAGLQGGQNGANTTLVISSLEQTTGVERELTEMPDKLSLSQNYPNPFNAKTAIVFSLSESQKLRLAIYDLMGKEVQIILNQYLDSGNYSIIFDASGLSSGVYFYRLQAGETVETKRMVLLK